MESPPLETPRCPTCDKPFEAIVRRKDFVLLLCADCRLSVTMEASKWDATPGSDQHTPTIRRSA
jgi:hypothetical protein